MGKLVHLELGNHAASSQVSLSGETLRFEGSSAKIAFKSGTTYVDAIEFSPGQISIGPNPLWHSGSFDPASKLDKNGDTMTGELVLPASIASRPPLNLGHGVAVTSLTNGDLWMTTAGLFGRVNGVTQQYVPTTGTGATGTWGISVSGSAATLTTGRSIAISGIVTGTATTFNGSANISIPITDLNLSAAGITGQLPVARMGSGTASNSTFLRGDGTWATPTAVADWNTLLNKPSTFPSTIANVSGLQGALNDKASLTASVTFQDITATRGNGTGVIFFGGGTNYLHRRWDDNFVFGLNGTEYIAWHSGNMENREEVIKGSGRIHADWNLATTDGWWMAAEAANAPVPGTWFIGIVSTHNGDWITQEVWNFTGGADVVRYRRQKSAGTWTAWSALQRNSSVVAQPSLDGYLSAFFADAAYATQMGALAIRWNSKRIWQIGAESNGDFKLWSYDTEGVYQSNPITIKGAGNEAAAGSYKAIMDFGGRIVARGTGNGSLGTQGLVSAGEYGGGFGMVDGNAGFKMIMENQAAPMVKFYVAGTNQGWTNIVDFSQSGIYNYSGWFRSYGNTGWYNQTYGGGWNMEETENIRVYGSKRVMFGRAGGEYGDIELVSVSPTIRFYDSDEGRVTWLHYNAGQIGFLAEGSFAWAAYRTGGNEWHCTGNIAAYASDARLKNFHGKVDYSVVDHFFNTVEIESFDWDEKKMAEFGIQFKATKNEIGVSAQQMRKAFAKAVVVNEAHNPVATPENPNPVKHDILTIDWDKTVPLLIAEIQMLRSRVTKLEEEANVVTS